jgi:hypothetical protein
LSIERTFYCDAPDCEGHARTARLGAPFGMLTVTGIHDRTTHFCSWDCVLKYAAAQEPVETIPFHDGEATS